MTQAQIEAIKRQSVRESPQSMDVSGGSAEDSLVLQLSTVADNILPWGRAPRMRDIQLRAFWPTEPILASAVYSICIRNAAFRWTLEGPEATVEAVQDMLHMSELGDGWQSLITKICIDLFTQDNGAFLEIIRETDSEDSPIIGLAHLDASRCVRTGLPDIPVIYADRQHVRHKLKPYQVVALAEFPSAVETMNGMQLCAVSRVLRAAQLLRDISVFEREKVAGYNPNAIWLVSGVSSQAISDAVSSHKQVQIEKGMTRYVIPAIVASLDPNATVTSERLDLKSLPDGFDKEEAMRWYINQLALGFGADYQDFAPLPGRNLGSSTQSMILHEKSRGRGPAFFMTMIEQAFNFKGIMPTNVTFRYDEPDTMADLDKAELEKAVSEWVSEQVEAGVITEQGGRQILLDKGIISDELFNQMSEDGDLTTDVVATADVPVENKAEHNRRRRRRKKPYAKQEGDEGVEGFPGEVADFGEEERLEFEVRMAEDVGAVFDATLRDFKKRIGVKAFRRKQDEPEIVLDSADFWDDFRQRSVLAVNPIAREGALEAVAQNVQLGLAVDFDLVNDAVLDFSRTYTNEWWERLSTRTRGTLRKAVTNWQETGLGKQGLPDLVKAIEPAFGKTRAELIAANEVTVIFDEGDLIAHRAAGVEEEEWQTVRDSRVDDICRPLNGKVFPLEGGPRPVKDTHIG